MKKIIGIFLYLCVTILITSCGGGGGGVTPTPPANKSPVAVNDIATAVMNTPIDISVLANDNDPDGNSLTITNVSLAANGVATINSVGTIHYVPTSGFTGIDNFTYSISDGNGGTATASVSITVSFFGSLAIERASVATDGSQGNSGSWAGNASSDGRYVVFHSDATNLVSGATQGDIFRRDRLTSQAVLVSCDLNGIPGNNLSQQPAISGDGRYVAFSSFASNLIPGDTNNTTDIFVKDLQTGAIEPISVASDGIQGNSGSFGPSISADGRYVAFVSMASNFYLGDSINSWDIFIRDRQTGQTQHIGSGGNFDEGPSISADGRHVAFASYGVIDVYDRQTGQTHIASVATNGTPADTSSDYPSISWDGRYVAFTSVATNLVVGDTNGVRDVFVHDLQLGITTRASVASSGAEGNGQVADIEYPGISSDGRFVAFTSTASNLVTGDFNGVSDTFVRDMVTGQTTRVSVSSGGSEANGASGDSVRVSISSNGKYVVFTSAASNLVTGDSNGFGDVFIASNPFVP